MNASLKRMAHLVGIGCVWGVLLTVAPIVGSIVMPLPLNMDTPGLAERHAAEAEVAAVQAQERAMAEAGEIASMVEGMECWDPATGRVGTHLVVRDAETAAVSVVPFNDETYAQAMAGAFWTLKACEVA